ncbi:histone-like nucleoid-structuring protein Lsr2 [Arthrobacter bussei]|uniref:Lsr2 family protein n=1 Tax=Arthrobacter bussei TaxID=2594179 RepID=A0A7X1NSL9_9MICC|nr:Lsr2 family protein [Arthrobacter bussei]MPY12284.1 Lsr2 family protein [Arthrobacter bussei]
MAQRIQIQMIDDLNGQEAEETVRFGLDGTEYEIDLTTNNASELRSTLSQYVDAARKASGGRRGQGGRLGTSTSRTKRDDVQKIRQWAQDNGHNPSSRGRIPQSVVDAYKEANK